MSALGSQRPTVSVVVPSGRGTRLAFALEALGAQTLAASEYEVVVARDPRAPDAPPPPAGLPVRFVTGPAAGNIADLRNVGWHAANAPLVAFTDDDCRAAPDWLERLVANADDPGTFVQGRTEPDPDEVHLLHGLARSQEITGPSPFYQTCNLLYHRSLLEKLGGFDERFGSLGEDAELGLRARRAGARRRYVDDAVVWHGVNPRTIVAGIREAASRDTMPALVRRYPEFRSAMYRRVFWKRSHAALLLAAAGIVGSRRHPPLAALALPYLAPVLDPREAGGLRVRLRRAVHMPARTAMDAAEVLITLRAAARERTFLL